MTSFVFMLNEMPLKLQPILADIYAGVHGCWLEGHIPRSTSGYLWLHVRSHGSLYICGCRTALAGVDDLSKNFRLLVYTTQDQGGVEFHVAGTTLTGSTCGPKAVAGGWTTSLCRRTWLKNAMTRSFCQISQVLITVRWV